MRSSRVYRQALLTTVALLTPFAAAAQTAPASADPATAPADPAVVPAPQAADAGSKRVYTPADFARFAPKNAYDMLVQVPGFTIRQTDTSQRGLGQASENVLINGARIANKSSGAVTESQRIAAANVDRIEIVDAASLGIAGLVGEVANIVLKTTKTSSGQFEWRPDFRAHFAKPTLFGGLVSYTGKTGPVDYTLSVNNDTGRGGFGGDVLIYDGNGTLVERRDEIYHSEFEGPNFQVKLGLDGAGSSLGNLTLAYKPYWSPEHIDDRRTPVVGEGAERKLRTKLDGWIYDVNGDYEFAAGPGRLKLIGSRHYEHEPLVISQVLTFDDGSDPEGVKFDRDTEIGETIFRGEYRFKTGRNDWQISVERAFNSLDQVGRFFELNTDGEFEEIDFPQGTGKVEEVRYEAIGTLSRPITPKLDLQVDAGGEISRLDRVDDDQPGRKFFRPKGSITLGWRPAAGWDASLKLRRRVGQISFYDFLAQPKLNEDRENAGNPDLVPPQSWELEGEVGRELGAWGKTRLRAYYHRIEDIVDFIPLADHTEGVGNLPRATRWGFESKSTIEFEPIGWKGAKLDATFAIDETEVKDPLTGEPRPISGNRDRRIVLELRHDVPGTSYAWGADASYSHYTQNFFLTEVSRSWEGPWWVGVYVEHKDVMGMTVRAAAGNLLNARHRWTRHIYEDWRDSSPLVTVQRNNQLIGPIFSFLVKGNF